MTLDELINLIVNLFQNKPGYQLILNKHDLIDICLEPDNPLQPLYNIYVRYQINHTGHFLIVIFTYLNETPFCREEIKMDSSGYIYYH